MNYFLTGSDNMIKSFKCDLYPFTITLCIGKSIEEIVDSCYKKFKSKPHLLKELNPLRDSTGFCYDGGKGELIISIKDWRSPHYIGVLSHEISHACFFICERLGIDYSVIPQEAYCYLNSWITEKVYSLIEKDIAKI